jgi:hypothetical protein
LSAAEALQHNYFKNFESFDHIKENIIEPFDLKNNFDNPNILLVEIIFNRLNIKQLHYELFEQCKNIDKYTI